MCRTIPSIESKSNAPSESIPSTLPSVEVPSGFSTHTRLPRHIICFSHMDTRVLVPMFEECSETAPISSRSNSSLSIGCPLCSSKHENGCRVVVPAGGPELTLMPIPRTTHSVPTVPWLLSPRMPATFFPFIQTSLGHFNLGCRLDMDLMAWTVAMAPNSATWLICLDGSAGRKIMLTANPLLAGVYHCLSPRPRPAVCSLATTIVPVGAPSHASLMASSFVEPVDLK